MSIGSGGEVTASELQGLLLTRGFDPTVEIEEMKDYDLTFPYDDTTLDGWDG